MRILLLEDDRPTAVALEKGFFQQGHHVSLAADVASALGALDAASFDVAVLDVGVPGGSGYQVLERLRARGSAMPVLMLTARGSVDDRVEGLDRGADDYLVKPFSFAELAARLRALERRREASPELLRAGGLVLDLAHRRVTAGEQRVELTQLEFGLLAVLLRAGGEAVHRRELLREVWGYEFDPRTNVVDVHVNRLRRKLEDVGLGELVRTVRGCGYAAG